MAKCIPNLWSILPYYDIKSGLFRAIKPPGPSFNTSEKVPGSSSSCEGSARGERSDRQGPLTDETEVEMEHIIQAGIGPRFEKTGTRADAHACKASLRDYEQAREHLKRAERDLAETVAFIAASLTTVTAIQAVISIADERLKLPVEVLQIAFQSYIALFLIILVVGFIRAGAAMRRRSQAEQEVDQTKRGVFEFCPMDQWPKPEG
jgi:hypothetical protein